LSEQTAEAIHGPPGAASYVLAVAFPIVGVILAIVAFARSHVGPGFALLLTSGVAFFAWLVILASAGSGS
jgi:hypothetical protein